MKSINIYFEDEEYNQLIQKTKLSWHDFILLLLNREEKE